MFEHEDETIPLSPKYGLNPTIPICFWCGKEKNEIAILGRIDDEDSEAPHSAVINFDPCPECKAKMDSGIFIFAVDDDRQPTGQWAVLKEEHVYDVFAKDYADDLLERKMAAVSIDLFKKMIGDAQ